MLACFDRRVVLVALAAVLGPLTAAQAAELDPKAVQIKTPDQFKWRNPSMQPPNNAVLLGDPVQAGSLFVHINSFVPGNFGEAHYHPNDRYVLVVDGAPWRGTGNVVDPAHATRVPKGTFMIEEAGKVHWDGTKDEGGAYLSSRSRPRAAPRCRRSKVPGTAAIRRRRRSSYRAKFAGDRRRIPNKRCSPAIRRSPACM